MTPLSRISDALPILAGFPETYLVYDRNVAAPASVLAGACRASMALDASEAGKTMETVLTICRWLLEEGAGRDALLVAMGGGITTDLCGFAASIYKRGIRFGFIPTTLLAQVDAAIGGKNGVNLDGYKNMVGVIRLPEFTLVCPQLLETLLEREWKGGLAELLKTFLIDNSSGGYEKAVEIASRGQSACPSVIPDPRPVIPDSHPVIPDLIGNLIAAAAAVKERIIAEDLYEGGLRKKLNLGHTFAHAIERCSHGSISHGEAVSMGIILAARLSAHLGLCAPDFPERLQADFEAAGLPVQCPYSPAALADAMEKDKKASGGKVDFVLLRAVGDVCTVPLTVKEALDNL